MITIFQETRPTAEVTYNTFTFYTLISEENTLRLVNEMVIFPSFILN
jgi:hypothetical protein